jgi:hypothetical protein
MQRAAAAEKGRGRRPRRVPVIVDHYGVGTATAGGWIRRARDLGHLAPKESPSD